MVKRYIFAVILHYAIFQDSNSMQYLLYTSFGSTSIWKSRRITHMKFLARVWVWDYWCFTSHATIFQSYMWRHRCAGGLKKKLHLCRAPNVIDISQGSLTCPSYTDTGPPFLYGDSDTPPHLVAFYDTLGIQRTYSRLKPPESSWGFSLGCVEGKCMAMIT